MIDMMDMIDKICRRRSVLETQVGGEVAQGCFTPSERRKGEGRDSEGAPRREPVGAGNIERYEVTATRAGDDAAAHLYWDHASRITDCLAGAHVWLFVFSCEPGGGMPGGG